MSKVSRSTYQKLAEENKRLMKDIRLLVEIPSSESILCRHKWQKHFQEERELHEAMRIACKQYIKDHKDELPDFLTNGLTNKNKS